MSTRTVLFTTGLPFFSACAGAFVSSQMAMVEAQVDSILSMIFDGLGLYGALAGFACFVLSVGSRLLIPSFGQMIRKEKVEWIKNYSVAVSASILPTCLMFIAGLVTLLIPGIGVFLACAAALMGVVNNFKLLAKQMKSTNSLVNSLIIAGVLAVILLVTFFVAMLIIGAFFNDGFLESAGMLLENLM